MKTINLYITLCLLSLLGLNSCNIHTYKMTTKVNKNGLIHREILAVADSAYLAGDKSSNPYMFALDDSWKEEKIDEDKFNVKISKDFRNFNEVSAKKNLDLLANPKESLSKKFRWFYSYYTYNAVYSSFNDKIPVSIDKYMTDEEQKMWFQGDFTAYGGMNGIELKDELDNVEDSFWKWYADNMYEMNYKAFEDVLKKQSSPFLSKITIAKDSIFKKNVEFIKKNDLTPVEFSTLLNKHFNTNYFATFYEENKNSIDTLYKENSASMEVLNSLFENVIIYQLIMPGKLITTNAPTYNTDTLVWNVDVARILTDDFELYAESKQVNTWAFIITGLLIIAAVFSVAKILRKKY